MRTKAFLLTVATVVCCGALWACGPTDTAPALHIFDGATMGTTYAVRVVTPDEWDQSRRDRVGNRIQAVLDDVESKMSHYRPSSELSRFNRVRVTEPFLVSPETFDVVRQAYELSELTGGALDITVGPLVNAWGFGPVEPEVLPPDPGHLARLREHTGYTKLELDPEASMLRKIDPELECDLSAVAKGYGVDQVAAALGADGLTRFMVEVGGEIVAMGLNQQGGPWRIAIERPAMEGGVQRVVPLSGHAMATSGDYRNVREVDGHLFSHTIDPRTGWPVAHQLASVSVVAELCVVADGLATALEVLGPDEGYALAVEQGLAALFLVRDDSGVISEHATPAFEALIDANPPVRVGRTG
jgi:thiamine biosynthesis lipoprotein